MLFAVCLAVAGRPPGTGSISNGTPLPLGEKRSGTKLEKTSLSTGGFLRVPYGYRTRPWLRYWRAVHLFAPLLRWLQWTMPPRLIQPRCIDTNIRRLVSGYLRNSVLAQCHKLKEFLLKSTPERPQISVT